MDATYAASGSKRGRLTAAPPGKGPPANPVSAVVYNPTLLAKILAAADDWEAHQEAFRAVSRDARTAFDAACEAPLIYTSPSVVGGKVPAYVRRNGGPVKPPSPSEALNWALGMLRQGWRPKEVRIDLVQCTPEWQQGALDLLRAIPQLSGRPGEGVATLGLPAQLLSPSSAPVIAGAFPKLVRLDLSGAGEPSPDASHGAAQGLAMLLGAASGAEGSGAASAGAGGVGVGGGASAGAGGEGSSGGPSERTGPLLPRLTELALSHYNDLKSLPPGFAPVLRQAPQLRTLELGSLELSASEGAAGAGRGPLEELASLAQLTALSLHSCAAPLLPVLTGALTLLTSLELNCQYGSLSPALFAPLQGLQSLEIPRTRLEVTGLAEALSALTRLGVGDFTLPAQQLSQPLTSIPRWRLPAGLRVLGLRTWGFNPVEALAGLEVHPGLRLDLGSSISGDWGSFVLYPGRHTAPPVEEGEEDEEEGFAGTELLPAAEEVLCGALRFIRRCGLRRSGERGEDEGEDKEEEEQATEEVAFTIRFETERFGFLGGAGHHLLQPVGGAAGTGPGRPNHGRWLREAAALRPSQLTLVGIQLSYQDVETIGAHMKSIKVLRFQPPCGVALPALPLLAGLPRLQELHLDATPWAGDDPESTELRDQVLASLLELARARAEANLPATPGLIPHLRFDEDLDLESGERLRRLRLRALRQMRRAADLREGDGSG